MTDYYVDASRPDDTGDGTTPATAKKTINAGLSLLGNNDTLSVAAGEYTLTDSLTMSETNISISGVVGESVITAGEYKLVLTGSGIFKNIVIQNATVLDYVVRVVNSAGYEITQCDFVDNYKHLYLYGTNNTKIYNNRFYGNTAPSNYGIEIRYSGDSVDNRVMFFNNIIAPSRKNLPLPLYFRGDDVSHRYADVIGNILLGSRTFGIAMYNNTDPYDYTLNVCNNIIIGHGQGEDDGDKYATFFQGSNVTYSNNFVTSLREDRYGNLANTDGIMDDISILSYPRKGYLGLGIDDTGGYEYCVNTLIPALETYGLTMTWFVTVAYLGVDSRAAMKAWIQAGHEIGSHGYSHTNLAATTALTVTKASQTIALSIIRTDTSDSSTWSGTIQVSGEDAITITATMTLGELETALEAQGCTVEKASEVADAALAVCLDDMVAGTSINAGADIAFDETSYLHVEITEGVSKLQAEIRALSDCPLCAEYTVASHSAPYVGITENAMDALKTAGIKSSRSAYPTYGASVHSLDAEYKLAVYAIRAYTVSTLSGDASTDGQPGECAENVVCAERMSVAFNALAAGGSVSCLYMHHNTFDSEDLALVLSTIADFKAVGYVYAGNQEYIIDLIQDIADTTGETGSTERWYFTEYPDNNENFRVVSDFAGINAGTLIAGVNDIGQLDPWGSASGPTPNIGADQGSNQNLYRRDTGFVFGEASYTVTIKKILPTA